MSFASSSLSSMREFSLSANSSCSRISQRPNINFKETYSPIVVASTFRYLISLIVDERLNLHLMDVVTTYLYESPNNDIYMKLPEGSSFPNKACSREEYTIKLNKSLYGIKQLGWMWYERLGEYLLKEGYKNDPICPCIFMTNLKMDLS